VPNGSNRTRPLGGYMIGLEADMYQLLALILEAVHNNISDKEFIQKFGLIGYVVFRADDEQLAKLQRMLTANDRGEHPDNKGNE